MNFTAYGDGKLEALFTFLWQRGHSFVERGSDIFLRSPTGRKFTRAISSPEARLWNSMAMALSSLVRRWLDMVRRISQLVLESEQLPGADIKARLHPVLPRWLAWLL